VEQVARRLLPPQVLLRRAAAARAADLAADKRTYFQFGIHTPVSHDSSLQAGGFPPLLGER